MRRLVVIAFTWLGLAGLCLEPGLGWAGVFRFEDEAGTVHYTNAPSDPRYRIYQADPPAPAVLRGPAPARGLSAFALAIREAAERYGVEPRLVEAVIQVESGGNPNAVSPKGAQGLMQLMPQRSAELGVQDPFNPLQNLDGGVRHLRDLLQRFAGNVTLALAAYNAGEGAVRTYRGVPPFTETRDYVRKVRVLYERDEALTDEARPGETPQAIFQQVADDGTVTFTNIPPRPTPRLRRSF